MVYAQGFQAWCLAQRSGPYPLLLTTDHIQLKVGYLHTLQPWLHSPGDTEVKEMTREQAADENNFRDKETKGELEVQEKMPLLEWLANSYKKFGCEMTVSCQKGNSQSLVVDGTGRCCSDCLTITGKADEQSLPKQSSRGSGWLAVFYQMVSAWAHVISQQVMVHVVSLDQSEGSRPHRNAGWPANSRHFRGQRLTKYSFISVSPYLQKWS